VDEAAAEVIRLIYSLFMAGNNRNQICVFLREKESPRKNGSLILWDRASN
jgi:hypothetical protein